MFVALLSIVAAIPGITMERLEQGLKDCKYPRNAWQEHYCNITLQPEKYQELCFPFLKFPKLNGQKLKGIVAFYHGYTACPNHHYRSAEYVASLGYLVVTPLIVGQGVKQGYQCHTPGVCVGNNHDNPSFIPTSLDPYIEWADNMNVILRELNDLTKPFHSPDFKVAVIGLSFGSALGFYGTSRDTVVDRLLTVNGHFSTMIGSVDFRVQECSSYPDVGKCIHDYLQELAMKTNTTLPSDTLNPDQNGIKLSAVLGAVKKAAADMNLDFNQLSTSVLFESYDGLIGTITSIIAEITKRPEMFEAPVFNSPYGWGKECEAYVNKGGYCNFRIKHAIVLDAFLQLSLSRMDKMKPDLIYNNINTDLDGFLRDSVTVAITKRLAKNGIKTSRCHYPNMCTMKEYFQDHSDNRCGVPHACFEGYDPSKVVWRNNLHGNLRQFLEIGTVGVENGNGDANVCEYASETLNGGAVFDKLGPSYLDNSLKAFEGW